MEVEEYVAENEPSQVNLQYIQNILNDNIEQDSHFSLEDIMDDVFCDPTQSVADIINEVMFDIQHHE